MQSSSKDWHRERENRITALLFGQIMKRQKKVKETFMGNMFSHKPFVSKPTTYGTVNEITAKIMYINRTENHLYEVELVNNPNFPFLGASPDALVCCNGKAG